MGKYENFIHAFKKANPSLKPKTQYDKAQSLWNEVKKIVDKRTILILCNCR